MKQYTSIQHQRQERGQLAREGWLKNLGSIELGKKQKRNIFCQLKTLDKSFSNSRKRIEIF